MRFRARFLLTLALASPVAAAPVRFSKDVRPILARKCEACHQPKNRSGNVDLSGYSGVSSVAGAGAGSLLLTVVTGDKPRMPKAGPPLTPAEVETIRQWIAEGARNDGAGEEQEQLWWSLRPLTMPAAPEANAAWARTRIDRFVWKSLADKQLEPSPEADRRTLIRRVYYDLHGLPPAPEEIDAFVADQAPDAYERLVDRLLASPRYGERWARHWLDVVHYGDTHGYDKDKPRPNAWPYRDYVIRALNEDTPYARFVEEQLAGDVLYPGDPRGIVATGFIAAGPWDFVGHQELRENTTDKNITRLLDRDDMVMATMSTFTSMTVHCARCHNHKFDPIPQRDYYSLQAVFAGVDRAERPFDDDPALNRKRQALLERKRATQIELQPLLDKVEFAETAEIVALDDRIRDAKLLMAHIGDPKTAADAEEKARLQARVAADQKQRQELVDALVGAETYAAIDALKEKQKAIDAEMAALPKPRLVYAATDYFERQGTFRPALTPRPVQLLARGDVNSPIEPVAPGALSCVPGLKARFDLDSNNEGARRAALAKWITARGNMLTWRSIVNRVWHYHFGAGIVDTPNDFGRMGSQPSHPELLDWLAVWFRDDAQGSLKKLHRMIVLSSAYRQSSAYRAGAAKIDSENRLLWRMNRMRLDAESVRDSVLAVAGKLDLTEGGPGVPMFWFKNDHSPIYDYARFDPDSPGANRRSIYRFVVRSAPDPFMERLDCPDASLLAPKRSTTLTAIQALALWNNPFMLRMAAQFAGRLEREAPDLDGRIRLATRLTFGREPTADERKLFHEHAAKHGLSNLARLLFNTNEFLFLD